MEIPETTSRILLSFVYLNHSDLNNFSLPPMGIWGLGILTFFIYFDFWQVSHGHARCWVLVQEDIVAGSQFAAVDTPWGMLVKECNNAVGAGTLLVARVHSQGFSLDQGMAEVYFAISFPCW